MIRIENISKQNSHRLLFIEASAVLNKGEKIGLVGPNGAGKTTLFRMIASEEQPDDGQVSTERHVTIGYFNQDVGEMAGRSGVRSEEHTSELQSLMRNSYAVFCLNKKMINTH